MGNFTIQETNVIYNSHLFENEDRYVILDNEGFDFDGEHYSLEEAKERLNELNNLSYEKSI